MGTAPPAASHDAAELLLGAAACGPKFAAKVADLEPELFEGIEHRQIHLAMRALIEQGQEPTYVAIGAWLQRRGQWKAAAFLDLAHNDVFVSYLDDISPEGMPRLANAPTLMEWLEDGIFDRMVERLRCLEGAVWF